MYKTKISILLVLFLMSIIVIIWIDFDILPKISTNSEKVKEINDILRTISLSYITSFVFYLVVVFSKEVYDIHNCSPYIQTKLNEIVNNANALKAALEKIDDIKFKNVIPTTEELKNKLNKIELTNDAGLRRLYPYSWEQLFKEHSTETRNNIDRILLFLHNIDYKLVNRLTKIYECTFFNMSTKMAPVEAITKKLKELLPQNAVFNYASSYSDMIIEYLKMNNELKKHLKK